MKIFISALLVSLLAGLVYAKDNKNFVPVMSLLLQGDSSWGGDAIGSEHRPDKVWLSQFNSPSETVSVNTTIQDAIDSCPLEGYCVVQLDKSIVLSSVQFIDRSKTKILGLPGNKITFSHVTGGSIFEIGSDSSEIVIEGLEFDGESVDYSGNTIFAIYVSGQNIDKVAVLSNEIHHLHSNEDGHGIAFYGEGGSENSAISNVIIDNNHVYDMRTGSSESIAVNGNVKNWEITGNRVERVNNIAIVAIGGEGTVTPQTVNGRILPNSLDAARYGFIEQNSVTVMSTENNPAYGSQHSWAGAIYVDGAHHLYIANNSVVETEWAYDIGSENCVVSRDITLEKNSASNSYYGDFLVGGYAEIGFKEDSPAGRAINCDPRISIDVNEGHGYVENVTVKNNSFNSPVGASSANFVNTTELSFRIRQSIIIQSGVMEAHPNGVVSGDKNSIRISE